ncbi:septation protein SepH [Nocardioides sp. W7]|uniref:septation protein SepH n=1 Tax=Nocardioides sp. W7 TaxID=2931390 RepID=UPI001FD0F9EC|nr:septation protein SepH [Nocardioides sp. W7]
MAHLTLAGISEDGRRLLLVSDTGDEYTLAVDAHLRSALRGDTARPGQLEIRMDSTIRPRDIQARIRAGESPEAVAAAAKTTVEKIMPFAGPVLAERQHVAQRAQRSSVRRSADASGSARTLGDAVAAQLRPLNVRAETVEWDAWRREDGRWTLAALYDTSARSGTAHFTFDAPGNYVVLDDEDARWLVGDLIGTVTAEAPAQRDDLERARQRRQATPAPDELPLGDDAIGLVRDEPLLEQPLEAFLDDQPGLDETEIADEAADAAAADPDPEPDLEPDPEPVAEPVAQQDPDHDRDEPPARRPVRKSRGRASVPSWDEIMFGGGKQD